MVSYTPICTVAEVEAYFKTTFSTTTDPTTAQVENWISNATALIYGAIQDIYIVPVTDEDDLAILKEICEAYVRDKVNYTRGANVYTIPKMNTNVPRTIKFDSFTEAIEMLKNGDIVLINTSASSITHVSDYNYTNSISAVAEKGVDQW